MTGCERLEMRRKQARQEALMAWLYGAFGGIMFGMIVGLGIILG